MIHNKNQKWPERSTQKLSDVYKRKDIHEFWSKKTGEYLSIKASNECSQFTPTSTLARIGVKVDNIWLAKHRLYNVNTAIAPEQPTETFSSTYSQDPFLIDTHSPLAWSIALHCHYQEGCTGLAIRPSNIRHRGWRTCHRVSLKFGVIINHK
jgi:hypothetical protein